MASSITNRWFTSFSFLIFSLLLLSLSPPAISSILRLPSDGKMSGAGDVCPVIAGPIFPGSCPVKCFRPDPVCGEDGITYWCGCADAHCSGTRVAKLGFCEVGNGRSGPISGQALLLAHIVWLIVLGFSVVFGLL